MSTHSPTRLFPMIMVWLCLLALSSLALAQGSATPIAIGHNAFGELTAAASTAQYSVSAKGGESVTLQMLALSPDLVPSFRLLNPTGIEILSIPNPTGLATLSANAVLGDAGVYIIEISGENNTLGQFALSLQAGPPSAPPVDLAVNTLVSDSVGSQTPVRVYQFSTTPADALVLSILSQTPDAGPQVGLYDQDANKLLASNDVGFGGVTYHLPSQGRNYRLEVHASGAGDTTYSVCLGDCGTATPTLTATLTATAAVCTATARTAAAINVRSGPGTIYADVGLLRDQPLPVLGRYPGAGGWYEVSINGTTGWVAASVTHLLGDCAVLAQVAAPANAPLVPTQRPTQAPIQPTAQSQPAAQPPPSGGGSAAQVPTAVPTTAPTTAPLPDLTVSIGEAHLNSDGTVAVRGVISNIGTREVDLATLQQSVAVSICINGTDCTHYPLLGAAPTGPFASGATWTIIAANLDFTPTSRTLLKISISVDDGNKVAESNEANNTATESIPNF